MKKGVMTILAVAIIGALGVYSKSHSSSGGLYMPKAPAHTSASAMAGMPAASQNQTPSGSYKDGTFTGPTEDTPYGPVQIAVVISGGNITDVHYLQMPSDLGHTQEVTAFAEPLLKETTLQKQNANIDFVSGATSTSEGYAMSLQAALDQATIG